MNGRHVLAREGTIFQMPQKLQNVFKPPNCVPIDNKRQPFSLWDHDQDNNISKKNIHFMHLINIGHAPLFHIISYMGIFFLVSIYIILYKNRGIKNLSMC